MFHVRAGRGKKIASGIFVRRNGSAKPKWRKRNRPGPHGGATRSGRTQGWSGLMGDSPDRSEYSARSVYWRVRHISCRQKSFIMSREEWKHVFQQRSVLTLMQGHMHTRYRYAQARSIRSQTRLTIAQTREWRTPAARVMLGGTERLDQQNCGGQRRLGLVLKGQVFRWFVSWL